MYSLERERNDGGENFFGMYRYYVLSDRVKTKRKNEEKNELKFIVFFKGRKYNQHTVKYIY